MLRSLTEGCFINELWNTNEDENVSIARARLVSGEITKWHHLEGIAERYVILEGKGVVEVGDDGPSDVQPGDVVGIPAFVGRPTD
jgi:mannose-6-phosphate isomerase-like protein (cupin superfamily)